MDGNAFSYRIWCAAASFGQEPFSIAMIVNDFLKKNPGHPRIEILATDIADHALKRCKEGRYSQLEIQRGLPAALLVQHFKNDGEGYWIISPEIKRMVDFKKQNLLDSFSTLGSFNVIFCRYVLIYQDAVKKSEIFQRLEKNLSQGGYIILGASESAFGLSKVLDQQTVDGAILYQLKSI